MTSIQSILADYGMVYSILNYVKDELFIYDLSGRLVYVNEAGERSEGYRLEDKIGESLFATYNFENDIRLDRSPTYIALTEHRNVEDMLCVYHIGEKQRKKIISSYILRKEEEPVAILVLQHDKEEIYDLLDENLHLQNQIASQRLDYIMSGHDPFMDIPAFDDAMKQSLELAKKATETDANVMIYGQAGSDRNLIARAIHDSSRRSGKPFLSLNCSHFSAEILDSLIFGSVDSNRNRENISGFLEKAKGGTLYLEDISSLPDLVQSKLLRFIETDGRYLPLGGTEELTADVRIICSSQHSSLELIRDCLIQIRLFYCLSVFYIAIPSLKNRRGEIPELVDYYIKKTCKKLNKQILGVDNEVMSFFKVFEWPGNLTQFRKCIEAMVNLVDDGETIGVEDIPVNMLYGIGKEPGKLQPVKGEKTEILSQINYNAEFATQQRKQILEQTQNEEKARIIEVLQKNNGNITHTAEELGISRQLLYYRIKKYNIL